MIYFTCTTKNLRQYALRPYRLHFAPLWRVFLDLRYRFTSKVSERAMRPRVRLSAPRRKQLPPQIGAPVIDARMRRCRRLRMDVI